MMEYDDYCRATRAERDKFNAMIAAREEWMRKHGFADEENKNRKFAGMLIARAFEMQGEALPSVIEEGSEAESAYVKAFLADGRDVRTNYKVE